MNKYLIFIILSLLLILAILFVPKTSQKNISYDFILHFDDTEKDNFNHIGELNSFPYSRPMAFNRSLIKSVVRSLFSGDVEVVNKMGKISDESEKGIDRGGFRFLFPSARIDGIYVFQFKKKSELDYWAVEFAFRKESVDIQINRYRDGTVNRIEKLDYQRKGKQAVNILFFSDFLVLTNKSGVFFQMRNPELAGKGGIGFDYTRSFGKEGYHVKFAKMLERIRDVLIDWHEANQPSLKSYKFNSNEEKWNYIDHRQSVIINGKKQEFLKSFKVGNLVKPSIIFKMNSSLRYSVKVPENGVLEFHLFVVSLYVYRYDRLNFIVSVEYPKKSKTKKTVFNFGSLKDVPYKFIPFILDLKEFGGLKCDILFKFTTVDGKCVADEQRVNLSLASPVIYSEKKESEFNIILISLDTLRASSLGCYGYHRVTSTNIDEFAKHGIRFNNASSSSNWTLPSHMSMFTALYPSECGFNKRKKSEKKRQRLTWGDSFITDRNRTIAEYLKNAGYKTIGIHGGTLLSENFGFSKGFTSYERIPGSAEEAVELAIRRLEQCKNNKFFLFLHTYEIHYPYKHDYFLSQLSISEKTHKNEVIAKYDSGIRYTDREIGRLMGWLKKTGLFDKTLIIITSDHGENFDNIPQNIETGSHGYTLYDTETHIPLIFGGAARFNKSRVIKDQVSLVDILPTILDFLEIPLESDIRGESLMPLIDGKDSISRLAYSEATYTIIERKAIRTLSYKLIATISKKKSDGSLDINYELYNLRKDKKEKVDVLHLEPGIAKNYMKFLNKIIKSVEENRARLDKTKPAVPINDKELLDDLKRLGYIGN